MTQGTDGKRLGVQDRILAAAVELFAKVGYNGTSTREIALAAEVNECTLYRHYAKKRDLFLAALESELQKLTFSADAIGQLGDATVAQDGFHLIFRLIFDSLGRQPNLVRLLQFSALEAVPDLKPLYRKYFGGLLQMSRQYLERQNADEPRADPYMLALVLAGAAVSHYGFYQLLPHPHTTALSSSEASIVYASLIRSRTNADRC